MNDSDTITDTDLENLRHAALAACDFAQVALCDWVLGRGAAPYADALYDTVWAEETATVEDARAECERLIREVRAEADER